MYVDDKVVVTLYDGSHFGELAMMKTTAEKSESDQKRVEITNLDT